MSSVFNKALKLLVGVDPQLLTIPKKGQRVFRGFSERELIQLESDIGSQLFGPIPASNRREFFCLDKDTWIWYEEWMDIETGKQKSLTTRYEIHPKGILKAQEGSQYNFVEGQELQNLLMAIGLYYEQVARKVYRRDPATGKKLP